MSNQFLKLRRSAVPGKVPTTSSLEFGEIALNTYDGLAFMKKSGSNGEEIVTLGSAGPFNGYQIVSGSVSASVNVGYDGIFIIKSGSYKLFEMSGSGETTVQSNLFIIKNFTTQQPVLTVSESVVQIATHSFDPNNPTQAGSIWFTANNLYIGLE